MSPEVVTSGSRAASLAAPRALWVSTGTQTRGGIATYVQAVQQTPLWIDWNIRHVATHRDGSAWAKIAAFVTGAALFVVELIRFRPSLVHLHSSADASFVRKAILSWISQLAGVPVVLHMHGSDFQEYYDNSPRLVQAAIRNTLSRASAVVALGDAWAARLQSIAPDARITVIPNAVRPARKVEQAGPGEPVRVVFLGRIGERKGTFRLLEAWARLGARAATLTIAGDGEVERARCRIRELCLQDSVELREWLSPDDVNELLSQSHVLVLPSRNEGQPMAVMEAMARGLCIVASNVGGLGEMIGGGCGVIVSPDDVDSIAAALRLVIDDPELRARYGAAAYARVTERYDVRPVAGRLDALYRQVATRQSKEKPVPRIFWYAGRAAAMSPRELAWRAWRVGTEATPLGRPRERPDAAMLTVEAPDWDARQQAFRDGGGRPVLLDQGRADRIAARYPSEVKELLDEAERLLAGERAYFGYPSVNVGSAIDWNYDPFTGYRWPALAAHRINHRVASSDPKWIWELNRLQHLPVLTEAWLFTGEPRFANAALDHLDSWIDQNPVGTGIAWRGAFEAGMRAISVAVAAQGLRNSPAMTPARYRRIVRMLDASARYCWKGRSLFSSANNHLIGELAGLLVVHLLHPELAAPKSLRQRAIDALARQARLQVLPDGAGAEQSIAYQMFAVELMCLVAVLLRLEGDDVPATLLAAIDRSASYLIGLIGSDDPTPRYGDDDDGFALRLGAEHKRAACEHLGIVAAVTRNRAAARHGTTTLSAAWIADALGTDLGELGAGVGSGETTTNFYAPQGGLVVLRGHHRQRVTMDVGPLGYLSIAAHGHADALAVTLSAEGRELVVDPGAASYYREPAWRAAHRGTRMHPTVCVDNADQSVPGGLFYWRRHAVTTVHAVDLERGIVDAEHDGYRRLADPVVHRRWLIATPQDTTVAIVDLLYGRSEHDVATSWPLHPDLTATAVGNGHMAARDGRPVLRLCYAATAPIVVEQVRADAESGLGWWSDRLESRTPAWLVGVRCRAELPLAVLSVLSTSDEAMISAPSIVREGPTLIAGWCEHGVRKEWTIDTTAPGAVVHTTEG